MNDEPGALYRTVNGVVGRGGGSRHRPHYLSVQQDRKAYALVGHLRDGIVKSTQSDYIGALLLPLDGKLVHHRGTPGHFVRIPGRIRETQNFLSFNHQPSNLQIETPTC